MKLFLLLFFGYVGATEITKLHVKSEIQMRYAITEVNVDLRNKNNDLSQVDFNLYIPKEAFVSYYSVNVKGQEYVSIVKEKEVAQDTFDKSNTTSGLVQSSQFNAEEQQITFSAKLDPAEKAKFILKYEELLPQKDDGRYTYEFNIDPVAQSIPDVNFDIFINETLPLKDISVKREFDRNSLKSTKDEITNQVLTFDEKTNPNEAQILHQTKAVLDEDWKLILQYSVQRPDNGNEIQIGAGKFVHYFNPRNFPTLPKHVIFVIDISGSMSGTRIEQTKSAVTMILSDMGEAGIDYFNIITFNDKIRTWRGARSSNKTTFDISEQDGVAEAYNYVLDLVARDSTNINDALLEAIETAKNVKNLGEISDKTEQMIIFLTDGQPTAGESNRDKIRENVKKANEEMEIPIYGLAFGNGADYDLLVDISSDSFGFAQRIYESGNSFEQLENFYKRLSDPKLKNVRFDYIFNGQRILPDKMTKHNKRTAYSFDDMIIAGEIGDQEINEVKIIMQFEDDQGQNVVEEKEFKICNSVWRQENNCLIDLPQPQWERSASESFLEKLWAFKRIRFLLNDESCQKALRNSDQTNSEEIYVYDEGSGDYEEAEEVSECETEALELAIKYNFVTEITSMVLEETDEYLAPIITKESPKFPQAGQNYLFKSYAATNYATYSYGTAHRSGPTTTRFPSTTTTFSNRQVPKFGLQRRNRPKIKLESASFDYDQGIRYYGFGFSDASISQDAAIDLDNFDPSDCHISLFKKTYLRGEKVELSDNELDLSNLNFDDQVGSLEVDAGMCCWELFENANFSGESQVFKPAGKYESSPSIKKIFKRASSVKKLGQC